MSIIPSPPHDVRQTKIVRILSEKSTTSDGAAEKVEQFIETASPLVDLIIGGPFREYTLHNRDHAKKLLHLMEYLIPNNTIESLTSLELLILIYSAYLHDMGMCLTSIERNRIISSDEFADTVRAWPELWEELELARRRLNTVSELERPTVEATIYQLNEAALTAYLRPRHATADRYATFIDLLKKQSNRPDLFEHRGVSFESTLIAICSSHNLDVGVLAEVNGPYDERFPRTLVVGGEHLNAQFCAALLRLADILDFDRERTPRILFESLDILGRSLPGAEVTLREWQKHMAVHSIEITTDEIVISAECRHPVIEKSIRDFCQMIEREVRDTISVVKRNPPEIVQKYSIELPLSVRPSIRSIGYVFRDLSLRLNQSAIISLLMGERLYSHRAVPIRELVQNAIDASSARQVLEDGGYVPQITLTSTTDEAGRLWISIDDNGIGMDEYVLSEYFLKLGNSYYDSPEFERMVRKSQQSSFSPIARFGIGIVSVFMIADVLEVTTSRLQSPRGDSRARFVRVERMGGLAFVSETSTRTPGTNLRIRLRPEYENRYEEFIDQIAEYLQTTIIRPKFDIDCDLMGKRFTLTRSHPMSLKPSAKPLLAKRNFEVFLFDLSRWSDRISGTAILLFARNNTSVSPTGDPQLSYRLDENTRVGFGGPGGIDPRLVIDGYPGNRVTVNGFRIFMRNPFTVTRLPG